MNKIVFVLLGIALLSSTYVFYRTEDVKNLTKSDDSVPYDFYPPLRSEYEECHRALKCDDL